MTKQEFAALSYHINYELKGKFMKTKLPCSYMGVNVCIREEV